MADSTAKQPTAPVFDASTIAKYRKVRTLSANAGATPAERQTAQKLLKAMETKYQGLKLAVDVRDEYERRTDEVKKAGWPSGVAPSPTASASSTSTRASSGPRVAPNDPWPPPPRPGSPFSDSPFPQGPSFPFNIKPGSGVDPFQAIPRAQDIVNDTPFGPGIIGDLKRRAALRFAKWTDTKLDSLKEQWEALSLQEIENELKESAARFGQQQARWQTAHAKAARRHARNQRRQQEREREVRASARHPFGDHQNPVKASQQAARKRYFQMSNLDDLLRDPHTTEAAIAFEEDEDEMPCVRFDFSIPMDVWERLKRGDGPEVLSAFLTELVEEAEEEMRANDDDEPDDDDDDDGDDGDTYDPNEDPDDPDSEEETQTRSARRR